MGETLDRTAARDPARGPAPVALGDSSLMQLEDLWMRESLFYSPDQRVAGRRDVEGDATDLGPREFDVVRQVKADDPRLFLGRADELASEMYLSHDDSVRREVGRSSASLMPAATARRTTQ